jgi:hypothetical protein
MPDEHNSDTAHWKIITDQNRFEELKADKSFSALVALSRAVNMLRFVQMPLLSHEGDTSPAASRASLNSLFFSCAIYQESYLLVQRLKVFFWKLPLFQKLEEVSIKNPKAQKILTSSVTNLRNKLVFHLDIDEIGRQLQQMDSTEPTFLNAMGEMNAQVHYILGDRCAWQALHEPSLLKTGSHRIPNFRATIERYI